MPSDINLNEGVLVKPDHVKYKRRNSMYYCIKYLNNNKSSNLKNH